MSQEKGCYKVDDPSLNVTFEISVFPFYLVVMMKYRRSQQMTSELIHKDVFLWVTIDSTFPFHLSHVNGNTS